jgi:hypothetical protein
MPIKVNYWKNLNWSFKAIRYITTLRRTINTQLCAGSYPILVSKICKNITNAKVIRPRLTLTQIPVILPGAFAFSYQQNNCLLQLKREVIP